jgi:hypothetical protein
VSVVSFDLLPVIGQGTPASPAAADIDRDGLPDAIFHGNGSVPLIVPVDPGGQQELGAAVARSLPQRSDRSTGEPTSGLEAPSLFGANSTALRPDVMLPLFAQPSAGDLDQDGVPDLVTAGGSLGLAQNLFGHHLASTTEQHLLSMHSGRTGRMFPGSPLVIDDFMLLNGQAIADITGDGYPEVLTGSGGYFLHAVDACGTPAAGFPKYTGQSSSATPAVGDITGDGNLEVVVTTRAGFIYAWRTRGRQDGIIAWESFHHDNRNTGHLGTPLEQGKTAGERAPLSFDDEGRCILDEEPAPAEQSLVPAGNCACRAAGGPMVPLPWLLFAGLLAGAAVARMRGRERS